MLKFFISSLALIGLSVSANEIGINVINSGSKTGPFFIESQILATELSKKFKVDFANPGNACVAQSLVRQSKKPTLFLWDSTYEAQGRVTNNAECQLDFKPQEVLRVDNVDWQICSINPKFDRDSFTRSLAKHRVGYANPGSLFLRSINATNTAFKTEHTGVHYTAGLGAIVTALQNGEVDYAILSPKFVQFNRDKGLVCHWNLGDRDTKDLPSLAKASGDANNVNLLVKYQVLLVGKNFDTKSLESMKSHLKSFQDTAGTPLSDLYRGLPASDWTQSPSMSQEWEKSITINMVR
jgi:hypothetical protein